MNGSKYQLQDMSASMYENRNKRSEKSPDFSGTIKVENKEYSISLWFANDKQGKPRVSKFGGRLMNGKISEPNSFKGAGQSRSDDNINDLSFEKPKDNGIKDIDIDLF